MTAPIRTMLVLFAFGITAANSADCPPERPIKRTLSTGMMNCTLVACIGKLVCPPNPPPGMAECFRMPASDCNTCTPVTTEICLSQAELDKAR
jgi:hypothetical protein